MLRLTVAVVAIALAGTASAAKWRDLRVDGSSEDAFAQSLAAFKEKLSPARRYVFGEALKDIWIQGVKAAEAAEAEYTASDYYRRVDGLTYEQVVKITDPTGETAAQRHRAASLRYQAQLAARSSHVAPSQGPRPHVRGLDAAGLSQQQHHGGFGMNPSGTY